MFYTKKKMRTERVMYLMTEQRTEINHQVILIHLWNKKTLFAVTRDNLCFWWNIPTAAIFIESMSRDMHVVNAE